MPITHTITPDGLDPANHLANKLCRDQLQKAAILTVTCQDKKPLGTKESQSVFNSPLFSPSGP
ncbi:hypothetical protein DC094_00495 [Pelagibaculum spongiae]|uniref:Uncharacterized protein n=1 Tax=Pelagibaculum spongiae TaxID=2080658 RepID=A0A2V1GXP7_9GAMM|nr:hypothetical protein DC094_00495 [Pelagibaculum spongiae]